MDYRPREGVDYLIDLYQIAAASQDAGLDEIKQALNARAREYYPDRLHGLAPEFQEKGERMARLLNRARTILLDQARRNDYDAILTTWEGPVSTDGTPVILLDDSIRAEMAMRTPEEIETVFAAQREQITNMVRHNPKQQAMLGRMLEAAEGNDADEIREAYDAALVAEDQVLAIEEAERGRLVGLPKNKRYEVSLGHAEKVQLAIEDARSAQEEDHTRRALGGVSTKLALLAGEGDMVTEAVDSIPAKGSLPYYFDEQATCITKIAAKREELLRKRLEVFWPTYPIAELQTNVHPNFVIGISADTDDDHYTWIAFNFDKEATTLTNIEIPEKIQELLDSRHLEEAYNNGFNILTFAVKEHIELNTLLEEAYNKHLQRYFPGALN